jgi:hypothetical protein
MADEDTAKPPEPEPPPKQDPAQEPPWRDPGKPEWRGGRRWRDPGKKGLGSRKPDDETILGEDR